MGLVLGGERKKKNTSLSPPLPKTRTKNSVTLKWSRNKSLYASSTNELVLCTANNPSNHLPRLHASSTALARGLGLTIDTSHRSVSGSPESHSWASSASVASGVALRSGGAAPATRRAAASQRGRLTGDIKVYGAAIGGANRGAQGARMWSKRRKKRERRVFENTTRKKVGPCVALLPR